MALQEVQGKGYLSKAADTYSLGVLLWEMFHGMPPYAAENGHLVNNTSFPRFDLRHREDAPFSYVVVALACLSEDFEKRCVALFSRTLSATIVGTVITDQATVSM